MNISLVNPRYSKFYGSFSEAKEVTSGSPPPLGVEFSIEVGHFYLKLNQ